ncbi:D-3-phosphoglycerate dehydrogenase [Streptomyces sp. NBRC 110611]|nr:D-3-phosphoglycerate dehydrogenase [Streptomyces sp. NBRC 110611]
MRSLRGYVAPEIEGDTGISLAPALLWPRRGASLPLGDLFEPPLGKHPQNPRARVGRGGVHGVRGRAPGGAGTVRRGSVRVEAVGA